ncbi:MAG TPA: hypothetical protein VFW62_03440, partial [bacterium]|nr:hypothetical protein [bacterium]
EDEDEVDEHEGDVDQHEEDGQNGEITDDSKAETPGNDPSLLFEGSGGCSLNPGLAGDGFGNGIWMIPLAVPLLRSLRRKQT